MEKLLRRLTNTGLRRGFGGSRPWLVVGIIAVGGRALRRLANPKPEVLFRTALRPGDAFEIRSRPPV